MAGLSLAGLMGIGVAITAHEELQRWARTIGWVALALYASGFVASFFAAIVNWGGVFLGEPRNLAALNVLVLGSLVQAANHGLPWLRIRGILSAMLAAFLIWSTATAPLVLHPESAVRSSSSFAIQSTFFGLFILVVLAASWVVWYVQRNRELV